MHPPFNTPIDREESPVVVYAPSALSCSVIWVVRWMMRAYFVSCHLLGRQVWVEPEDETRVRPPLSRHIRRARAACLRHFDRDEACGRLRDLSAYMPRQYEMYTWLKLRPAGCSKEHFKAFYARESGLGRLRVFELSTAHAIGKVLSDGLTRGTKDPRGGLSPLASIIVHDAGPAPP